MLRLNDNYSDYSSLTAQQAMEDTLIAACHRNLHNLKNAEVKELPNDLEPIAKSYLSEVLSFVSACTNELLFCCSAVFSASRRRFPSTDSLVKVSKDQISYTIGENLWYRDVVYSLDDDSRTQLMKYVVEYISEELNQRGFIVSVTPSVDSLRIFISWGLDKEAAGYIFHITDYSQIDAIKSGVPASDVFA